LRFPSSFIACDFSDGYSLRRYSRVVMGSGVSAACPIVACAGECRTHWTTVDAPSPSSRRTRLTLATCVATSNVCVWQASAPSPKGKYMAMARGCGVGKGVLWQQAHRESESGRARGNSGWRAFRSSSSAQRGAKMPLDHEAMPQAHLPRLCPPGCLSLLLRPRVASPFHVG